MISYQQTDSQTEHQYLHNDQQNDVKDYKTKIKSIWQNINKTKNLDQSQSQSNSYNKYKDTIQNDIVTRKSKNRSENKRNPNQRSKIPDQLQKDILTNVKNKKNHSALFSFTQSKRKPYQNDQQPNTRSIQSSSIGQISHKRVKQYQKIQQELIKSKQNTNILMKKLIQAQEQIQYLQFELQKQIKQKQELRFELNSNNRQNDKQNHSHNQIKEKNSQNQLMKSTYEKYQFKLRAAQKQINQKNLEISYLQQQIQIYQKQVKNNAQAVNLNLNPALIKNYKGSELLQLSQAYKTIQRLVNLLKTTEQYKILGNFAQQLGSIHFLDKIPKNIKSSISAIKIASRVQNKANSCSCMQVKINQRLLWTPLLCYKKMLEMKIKHQYLNQECIQEVLFQMNRIYLSKEQTRVAKLKNHYENEIQKLKKKTQLTYDQMLAKKQIQRLKKQIQSSKKKTGHKKTIISNSQTIIKAQNNPKLYNLKAIGQYEDQLRLKQKENKLLIQRIKLLQTQTSSYDKSLYMEGILWIIDKMLEQLDGHGEDIRQFQIKFRNKISNSSTTEDWLRLYKQFFESIQEINLQLIEKILNLKQSTVNKIQGK